MRSLGWVVGMCCVLFAAGCAGPPPDGFFTDFFGGVRFAFVWDDGDVDSFTAEDAHVYVEPLEDGTYAFDPGTLELIACFSLVLAEDGPPEDGVLRLHLAGPPASCSWRDMSGGTIAVVLDRVTASWSERELTYSVGGTATWGARTGTLTVSFSGTRM